MQLTAVDKQEENTNSIKDFYALQHEILKIAEAVDVINNLIKVKGESLKFHLDGSLEEVVLVKTLSQKVIRHIGIEELMKMFKEIVSPDETFIPLTLAVRLNLMHK